MAEPFNPDNYLKQVGVPITQAVSGTDTRGFDPDAYLQQVSDTTHVDGLPVSHSVAGTSASTPINSSPVSAIDRFKLSLGNEQGNMEYLKTKFEGVAKDDNGDLVVKDQGKWKRVDEKDSWELTKDLADLGGLTIQGGVATAGAAAAGVASGGFGAVIGAGAATALGAEARITLGRMAGTYKADPLEEVRDLGFETLLGSMGQRVLMGVKPTAAVLGNALQKGAATMENAPNATKAIMAKTIAATTGATDEQASILLADPAKVGESLKQWGRWASPATIKNGLKEDSVEQVKLLAENAKPALNRMYLNDKSELLNAIPKDFTASPTEPIGAIYAKAVEDGVIKATAKRTIEKAVDPEKLMLDLKSGNLGKYNFEMVPQADLVRRAANGELDTNIAENAIDKDAYSMMSNFFETVGKLVPDGSGPVPKPMTSANASKLAANRLIETRKILSDTIYNTGEKASDQQLNAVRPVLMKYLDHMDAIVKDSLDKPTNGAYSKMLSRYNEMSTQVDVFKRAAQAAKNTQDAPMESLLNKFTSGAGNHVSTKAQLRGAAEMIAANSPTDSGVHQAIDKILTNDSAQFFSQIVRPGVGKVSLHSGGLIGAYAAGGAPAAIGAAVATSPRATLGAAQLAQGAGQMFPKATQHTIVAARAVKDFMGSLTKEARQSLLNNPQMFNAVMSKIATVPQQAAQASDDALNRGQ